MRACSSRRYSTGPSQAELLCHYVIVRSDLARGVQAAQIVHAAGESSPGNLPEGTHAIVLAVPGELELDSVATRLKAAGIQFVRIEEPGRDEKVSKRVRAPTRRESPTVT